ncbi:MAG: hypothetical protein IKR69_06290 [Bacteroidales bacterium]|nr:hypothetical protein [Bacteroidales bacterium]
MKADGTVLKKDKDIRGGEIVMGPDGTPTGFLKEQAGTYTRFCLDNESLYPVDVAKRVIQKVQEHLLSEGYTMYIDGWGNYFNNDNFFKAARRTRFTKPGPRRLTSKEKRCLKINNGPI